MYEPLYEQRRRISRSRSSSRRRRSKSRDRLNRYRVSRKRSRSPIKKGSLSKYIPYDYKDTKYSELPTEVRHETLEKAVDYEGAGNIIKKLNIIYVLQKNRNPEMANFFRRDMHWVQKNFE